MAERAGRQKRASIKLESVTVADYLHSLAEKITDGINNNTGNTQPRSSDALASDFIAEALKIPGITRDTPLPPIPRTRSQIELRAKIISIALGAPDGLIGRANSEFNSKPKPSLPEPPLASKLNLLFPRLKMHAPEKY